MFKKYIKITEEKLLEHMKEIEMETRKQCKAESRELLNKYLALKMEHQEQQQIYIKTLQENEILKAKLEEIQEVKKGEEAETLKKYSNLANNLFADNHE